MSEDLDRVETQEWRDALGSVVEFDGPGRAEFLLAELHGEARRHGVAVPFSANTPYLNTIPVDRQPPHPGDREVEHKIRSLIRWNAVATVLRANKESSELGGHIASFQSAATLYDTGFQHFWHAPSAEHRPERLHEGGLADIGGLQRRRFVRPEVADRERNELRAFGDRRLQQVGMERQQSRFDGGRGLREDGDRKAAPDTFAQLLDHLMHRVAPGALDEDRSSHGHEPAGKRPASELPLADEGRRRQRVDRKDIQPRRVVRDKHPAGRQILEASPGCGLGGDRVSASGVGAGAGGPEPMDSHPQPAGAHQRPRPLPDDDPACGGGKQRKDEQFDQEADHRQHEQQRQAEHPTQEGWHRLPARSARAGLIGTDAGAFEDDSAADDRHDRTALQFAPVIGRVLALAEKTLVVHHPVCKRVEQAEVRHRTGNQTGSADLIEADDPGRRTGHQSKGTPEGDVLLLRPFQNKR